MTLLKNLLLCLALISCLQCKAQATFDIINTTVNVGEVPYDSLSVTGTVYYTNRGTAPLYLTKASTACPCTKVKISEEALAPGDTAVIYITHYLKGIGPFREGARISYFDPDDETAAKYIFISGTAVKQKEEE